MRLILILLILSVCVWSEPAVILVLKTTPKSGLETEANALPDIVMSRLSKYPAYRPIVWDEIEGKLGKDKLAEILKCQDSSCVVNLTATLKQYRLNPLYMLFCSISRYESDYTITLKIADAIKGNSFGMISTTTSSLEAFHTSGLIENIIRKIPSYVSHTNGPDIDKVKYLLPGISALGRDTSYFSSLTSNIPEMRNYVNLFCFHDERRGLLINTFKPIDTIRFPSVAAYKPDTGTTAFTITFLDSIVKNTGEFKYIASFTKDKSDLVRQILYTSEVPAQNRYASTYIDLKSSMLDKIKESGFALKKADSISGLYGVNYTYQYSLKYDVSELNLIFTAETSKFSVMLSK
jgi:hypothetical protein